MPKVHGMTFIELLLSLFIVTYCLLALSHLYLISITQTENNFFLSIAISQINSITNRLLVNPTTINAEIETWNHENAELLPQGSGTISGHNPYVITIRWYDKFKLKQVVLTQKIIF